ncbi:MAG: hypothetical protein QOF60_592 [Actinomycetota bacterium]|jgi:hypothetical protein|nr:hypothetical protein [Actinomycetota bacterium]
MSERDRARELGVGVEYDVATTLRQRYGLAREEEVLRGIPILAGWDIGPLLAAVGAYIAALSLDERRLARAHWNCWDGSDEQTYDLRTSFVDVQYTGRCLAVSRLGIFADLTYPRKVRDRNDQVALELAKHLAKDRPGATRVAVTRSQQAYKELILTQEAGAKTIDRIPKRIAAVFKHIDTVRAIADARYGSGNRQYLHYVEEHEVRQRQTFEALRQGRLELREIYSAGDLAGYLTSRDHGAHVELRPDELRKTVDIWLEALQAYDNYLVAITEQPTPLKYQVIDGRTVVLHEAIGRADGQRLNAIFVESGLTAAEFTADFNLIWDMTDVKARSKEWIEDYVRSVLD